ncbi:hypothetical protein DITRI_Ditri02bG0038100 [Diplodiscus trichospermus]
MATAILRTKDSLRNRFRHESLSLDHPFSSPRNSNPKIVKPKSNSDFSNSRRRKRSPPRFQSNNTRQPDPEPMVDKLPGTKQVMGQVKILKRGETLIAAAEKNDIGKIHGPIGEEEIDLALASTNRLGTKPETMEKQVKLNEFKIEEFHAGAASFVSPSLSSLPVPGFLGRTARASTYITVKSHSSFVF